MSETNERSEERQTIRERREFKRDGRVLARISLIVILIVFQFFFFASYQREFEKYCNIKGGKKEQREREREREKTF